MTTILRGVFRGRPVARRRTLRGPVALLLAVAVQAAALVGAAAQKPSKPNPSAAGLSGPERLQALLERVQLEQAQVETLQSSFRMRQESEMLQQAEESTGEFFFAAPDRVRWECRQPNPITVVIDGERMLTWYRDLGRAEIAEVGRYSDRILKYMNATSSLASLLESFDARVRFNDGEELPYRLELTPSQRRIARRLESITLWIDRHRFLPTRVRITAADGGVTEFDFLDSRVNEEIPRGTFDVELPQGVEVSRRSLDAAGSGR